LGLVKYADLTVKTDPRFQGKEQVLVEISLTYLIHRPLTRILRALFLTTSTKRMYAVVEISGQQYAVSPKQTIIVPLMDKNVGDKLEFTNILLASNNGNVSVGAPYIKGSVSATVVNHGKGDKVLVFHKKRRKGYQKLNGHRQRFTRITINDIKI
jgi:large subunit ribosomal protein L21